MIRRYGPPPKRGQRYRVRPGAYGVLTDGKGVLMTLQRLPFPEYQLPGGGIDPGEAGVRALHREVLEETGWAIAAPRHVQSYRRFTYMPEYDMWAEKMCHIFLARPVLRRGLPSEPDHMAVWMAPQDAVHRAGVSGDRAALRYVFGLY